MQGSFKKNQIKEFPLVMQPDAMDCGPACICMISKYYGKNYTLEGLREKTFISREGVSLLGISKGAENIGFRSIGGLVTFQNLAERALLPCIIHWKQEHFVVVYKIEKKQKKNYRIYVADPGKGKLEYNEDEFCENWISTKATSIQIEAAFYIIF